MSRKDRKNIKVNDSSAQTDTQDRPVVSVTEPRHAAKEPEKESALGVLKSLVIDVVIAVALAGALLYFIRPTIVKQSSMEDTLHNNDYMIMARQAYRTHGPERGDIIIFQSELYDVDSGDDKLLIKRVIGLPGDELSIKDSQLPSDSSKAKKVRIRAAKFTVVNGELFKRGFSLPYLK